MNNNFKMKQKGTEISTLVRKWW